MKSTTVFSRLCCVSSLCLFHLPPASWNTYSAHMFFLRTQSGVGDLKAARFRYRILCAIATVAEIPVLPIIHLSINQFDFMVNLNGYQYECARIEEACSERICLQ